MERELGHTAVGVTLVLSSSLLALNERNGVREGEASGHVNGQGAGGHRGDEDGGSQLHIAV